MKKNISKMKNTNKKLILIQNKMDNQYNKNRN